MVKTIISFFDWELGFRKKKIVEDLQNNLKEPEVNSLGIEKEEWDNFITKWKRENLS